MTPTPGKVDELGITGAELDQLSRENLGDPAAAPYTFTPAFAPDHFISQVIDYVSKRTDAACEYAEAGALTLLAAATPGVKARLAPYPHGLGTNLYVLGIGDSTRSRKSTSAGFIRQLQEYTLPTSLLGDMASPEGFTEQLAARAPDSATWFIDEFGEMLHKLATAKYMAGLRGLLLSAYDGRSFRADRHSKRNKDGDPVSDTDIIRDPHLSILGMTTPTLFQSLRPEHVESGFLARFAIVFPTSKPPRRPLQALPPGVDGSARLVQRLHHIHAWARQAPRAVRFTDLALATLDRFAVEIEETAVDDVLKTMSARLTPMAVKIAMLSAAGRLAATGDPGMIQQDALTIDDDDAAAAHQVTRRWFGYAQEFASRVGETGFERALQRCLQLVKGRADVPRRVIARATHIEKRTLDHVQETLVDRGIIRVICTPTSRKGLESVSWEWIG
jgi:hypothetical protein